MIIKIYEEEMIQILDNYLKEKFQVEKKDSFITYEDDNDLDGLHFIFTTKSENN